MEAESSGWKTAVVSTFGRLKSYVPLCKYRRNNLWYMQLH